MFWLQDSYQFVCDWSIDTGAWGHRYVCNTSRLTWMQKSRTQLMICSQVKGNGRVWYAEIEWVLRNCQSFLVFSPRAHPREFKDENAELWAAVFNLSLKSLESENSRWENMIPVFKRDFGLDLGSCKCASLISSRQTVVAVADMFCLGRVYMASVTKSLLYQPWGVF